MTATSNSTKKTVTPARRTTRGQARKATGVRTSRPGAKEAKADKTRGARLGLLPTSGPRAAISSKKAKKLEKRMAHALKRKMEAEGEVVMKDAALSNGKKKAATEDAMEVDAEIS